MSKAIVALFLLVLTGFGGLHAQTINCSQAFTRLEHAICSNPELALLDTRLADLSALAVARGSISERGIRAMRNRLALRCSGADEVDTCLVEHTRRAIVQLSSYAGVAVEIPASYVPDAPELNRHAKLQAEFQQAVEHHELTGSAAALARATFKLLDYYQDAAVDQLPDGVLSYEISALEATVSGGCGNLAERREWQRVIQSRGLSCDNALLQTGIKD